MLDIQPIIVIEIISRLLDHQAKEDVEESRCKYLIPIHAVGDGKLLQKVTIESDAIVLHLVQVDNRL